MKELLLRINRIFERKLEPVNRIEVEAKRILNNYDVLAKLNKNIEVWPVLKANAYGHGVENIAAILKNKTFSYVVVDSYYEALKVWQVDPKRKVLLIGPLLTNNYPKINWKKTAIMVQTFDQIEELGRLKSRVRVHVKINTGMNRQGFEIEEIDKVIGLIKANSNLELEGVMSHFANADEKDDSYIDYQEERFKKAYKKIKKSGIKVKYWHLAATAGSIRKRLAFLNAIRLGIGLYGYNPINSCGTPIDDLLSLKPALRLISRIVKVRRLIKGEKVSYGGTYTAARDSWIGLVPVGYFEGLDRRLSNNHWMEYEGQYYPVVGRICMNMCLVDFGTMEPGEGDEIEVYGYEGKNSIADSTERVGTIAYELLVKLNESIRREIT